MALSKYEQCKPTQTDDTDLRRETALTCSIQAMRPCSHTDSLSTTQLRFQQETEMTVLSESGALMSYYNQQYDCSYQRRRL